MGGDFKIKDVIGKGPCSMVKKAQRRTTKEGVAIKIIPKKKTSSDKLMVFSQLE